MKTTLLIPTWNEVDGMKSIMPRIDRSLIDQIIILDYRSTDGTIEYARENGYYVHQQQQKGLRHGYMEAYDIIEGDIVITFSPDGNSIPELMEPLIQKMREGYDMVIVSRYLGDAKSEDDDFLTAIGNWFFTKTINVLHGASYTDTMVIYRAYKKELIKNLDLHKEESYSTAEKLFHTDLSWELLLSVRAAKKKLRIAEIPGSEPPRIGGERKLQIFRMGAAFYFQILRELFLWR